MKKRILEFALIISIMSCLFIALPIIANAETDGIYTYMVKNDEVTITDCNESASGDIEIPATIAGCSVTTIGDSAFSGCLNLTSVTIPGSVTTIGEYAFSACSGIKAITIPEKVAVIGNYAFSDCGRLANITISNSVTTIGEYAFSGCRVLKNITIPASVTSIGSHVFRGCVKLSSIKVDENNPNYCSVDGNLFNKDKTIFILYAEGKSDLTYSVPTGVKSIENWAFEYCDALITITIPEGVTKIGDGAFKCCTNLNNITIPEGITSISDYAFYKCIALPQITIPASVTSIGEYAFFKCELLKNITFPDGMTSIGKSAFEDCYYLTDVTIPVSVTSIGEYAFSDCRDLSDVYYAGSKEEWSNITIGEYNDSLIEATIHFMGVETEPSYKLGDPNGDEAIDVKDVISIRRLVAGGYGTTIVDKAADVNKDDAVDVKDVIVLRRFIAGGYGIELMEKPVGTRFEVVDIPDNLRDDNKGETVNDIVILYTEEENNIYFLIDGILNDSISEGDALKYSSLESIVKAYDKNINDFCIE